MMRGRKYFLYGIHAYHISVSDNSRRHVPAMHQ